MYSVLADDEIISYGSDHTNSYEVKSTLKERKRTKLELAATIITANTGERIKVKTLIDSGATGMFIDNRFVEEHGWNVEMLEQPIPIYNIDGTLNASGKVTKTIDLVLEIQDHREHATFIITRLSGVRVILGHSWLKQHNPRINWRKGRLTLTRCPSACRSYLMKKSLPN